MLVELPKGEFYRVESLLGGKRVNAEIKAIVAKNNPGWVFVDDVNHPRTAVAFSNGQGGFYFFGEENNPQLATCIYDTIEQLFRPRLLELGIDCFEFSGTSLQWEMELEKLFAAMNLKRNNQHVYTLPDLAGLNLDAIPPNGAYTVEEISAELISGKEVDTSFVEDILLGWWASLDDFLRQGAGYCVICNNTVVALCYGSFRASEGLWAIGVDTRKDYRRKGFAKAVTREMLRLCQRRSIVPYWDCMEANLPSRRLAEGFGFSLEFVYQVFWFELE